VTQNSDPGKLPEEAGPVVMAFSHDVVNPLMSILALTQVLLLENRPDDRLNEDLRRIHEAAARQRLQCQANVLITPEGVRR